ncbi:MAG: O-antigen ligase family protein [Patescibacteria group bacterium]|nr:O-antigen ligase family protein [Patescibacteria group bacterium]
MKWRPNRRLVAFLFFVLVAFAPSGTRWILRTGFIDGQAVEPGTVSVFGMQLAALAFVVAAFWNAGRKRVEKLARLPVAWLAGLVAAVAFASVSQWDDLLAGLTQAGFVLLGVAVFWAILVFRPDAHETLATLVGGGLFQTTFGAWQFYTQSAFASKWLGMAAHSADQLGAAVVETASGRWLRAYGALPHPNVFGLYVGLSVIACVGVIAYRGRAAPDEAHAATEPEEVHRPPGGWFRFVEGEAGHRRHIWFYAFLPLVTAGLVFSLSRGAALATAVGLAWLAASSLLRGAAPTFRTVIIPSLGIIALTFFTLGYFYAEPMLTRVGGEARLEVQSMEARRGQYSDAATLLLRHPITGVGIGRMPLVIRSEVDSERSWWLADYVHNVPLLVAVETGLIGFFAWFAFIAYTIRVMFRRLAMPTLLKRGGRFTSGATAYAACTAAMLVACLFDHFLWTSWFGQVFFWIVVGLLHAAYLDLKEASEL